MAHGRILPGGLPEGLHDLVFRGFLDHGDFLEDHPLFPAQFRGVQGRVQGDVGQDVEGPGQVGVHDPDMETGDLPGGVGIGQAAEQIELLGDGQGIALFGALEGHVLPEVGQSFLARGLVPGAGRDEDAKAGGLGLGHVFGGHAGAVSQAGDATGAGGIGWLAHGAWG